MSNETKIIKEEYKLWRKNVPLLYDVALAHALEWPSLTVEWLPDLKPSTEDHMQRHQLVLGTHTSSDEQNYLMIMSVDLPTFLDDHHEEGQANTAIQSKKDQKKVQGNAQVNIKILHQGEINRCRHMPQNPFVIATKSPSSQVYIFDITKHPSKPSMHNGFCPQHICHGHDREGYGLAWNPTAPGILLSGSDDTQICSWDIQANSGKHITQLRTWRGHSSVVEDVAWHNGTPNIFGSVGDDKRILIWDTRNPSLTKPSIQVMEAHDRDINSLAFNPTHDFILATASSDQSIKLWDIRNMSAPILTLSEGHQNDIYQVQWNPMSPSLLSSCGADRRVIIWDISRISSSSSPIQVDGSEEAQDCYKPETFFVHGGHTAKVSEHNWSNLTSNLIASVAEDNVLQIWKPAQHSTSF